MQDNRQQEGIAMELSPASVKRIEEASGWVYDSTRQQMLNVETGEIEGVIEWLLKNQ